VSRVSVVHPAEAAESLWSPRDDLLVRERAIGDGAFGLDHGPFRRYERRLHRRDDGTVEETIDFVNSAPFWGLVFVPLYRMAFRRPDPGRPWWAPPERLDARGGRVVALLLSISIVGGYLGTVLTQTATFAADEFGLSTSGQSWLLASVRLSIVLVIPLAARADRVGRRRLIATTAVAGVVATAIGALSPGPAALAASQTVARACAGALILLVGIMSAEEMPSGSRAWAYGLIAMTQGLGSGMCLWALPLADIGEGAWRILFVLPLAYLPLIAVVARHLPESKRFEAPHVDAPVAGHGRRFWLLAATGLLLAFFATPASQLGNEFLREERGFSATGVSVFTMLTVTPAFIGIIIGGHLADVRGRRAVASIGIAGGAILTIAGFASHGTALWIFSLTGNMFAALVVPALGVYRPELFPTSLRGRAAGVLDGMALAGAAAGLLFVGNVVDAGNSYGTAFGLASLAPFAVVVLVLGLFPETAHRSLEDINPEDRAASALRDTP
jgi:putative MFS transporter